MLSFAVGGSVKIASSSAFNPPLIDPGFMQTPSDLEILTEAVKAAHRFVAAPSWSNFIIAPFAEGAELKTDAAIHEYIRNLASTFRHPIGTARMSAEHDQSGVVNPDLRVKNTRGLRVVDASIFVSVRGPLCQVFFHSYLFSATHFRCSYAGPRIRYCRARL